MRMESVRAWLRQWKFWLILFLVGVALWVGVGIPILLRYGMPVFVTWLAMYVALFAVVVSSRSLMLARST